MILLIVSYDMFHAFFVFIKIINQYLVNGMLFKQNRKKQHTGGVPNASFSPSILTNRFSTPSKYSIIIWINMKMAKDRYLQNMQFIIY